MGSWLTLNAADGHNLSAYRADPEGAARGAVVVLQEIFGVNSHIRAVCDRLAAAGYVAVAPALFDRFVRNFETGYSPEEVAAARKYLQNLDWDALIRDTEAAVAAVRPVGSVAVVGFCLGGSLAYLAALRIDGLAAAVGYYGGQVARYADEKPRCPVQLHFGETDHSIPLSDVETVRAKRPETPVYIYPAGHGFNCDERAAFHAPSAAMAWSRTLGFLARQVG
jgi:carboxymethylenebutenolidase